MVGICQYRGTRDLTDWALCSVLSTASQPIRSLREFSGLDHVTNTARQKFEYVLIDIDCQEEFVQTFSYGTIWKYKKGFFSGDNNRVFHQGRARIRASEEGVRVDNKEDYKQ